jgi:hypothetical protein
MPHRFLSIAATALVAFALQLGLPVAAGAAPVSAPHVSLGVPGCC